MDSGNEGEMSKHPQENHDDGAGCTKSEHSDDSELSPQVTDRGEVGEMSLKRLGELVNGNGSSSNLSTHLGGSVTEGDSVTHTKKVGSLSGSSSTSSSSEELFQVDTSEFNPRSSVSFSLKIDEDDQPESRSDISTPRTAPPQASNIPHNQLFSSMSPTETPPPVQTMDRSEGHDTGRIPSGVFESKPTTPMDWSVASNDSLFSLNVGSSSFSREQFLFSDLGKSGDFERSYRESGRYEDSLGKSSEFIMFSPPTPVQSPAPTPENDGRSVGTLRNNSEASVSGIVDDPAIDLTRKNTEERREDKVEEKIRAQPVPLNSPVYSAHSEGNSSGRSFAFPILSEPTKSDVLKEDVEKEQKQNTSPPQQLQPPQQQLQPPQQQHIPQPESTRPTENPKPSAFECLNCCGRCCHS